MKFLAFQLLDLMSHRCQGVGGRCLFRLTNLRGVLHHVQWQIELELLTQFEDTQQKIPSRERDIVSVI